MKPLEIQRLIVNPNIEIRIPKFILTIVQRCDIHPHPPLKPEENLISMNSLVVKKKDFLVFEKQFKDKTSLSNEKPQKKKKKAKTEKLRGVKKSYVAKEKMNKILKDAIKEYADKDYAVIAKKIIREQKNESPDDKPYKVSTLKRMISEYINKER